MSDALRIETTEWRVAQDGVTTFSTESEARDFAAKLRAADMPWLGLVRIQYRTVTVTAGHWQNGSPQADTAPTAALHSDSDGRAA